MFEITIPNVSIQQEQFEDTRWLRYFNIRIALGGVSAHIETLASSRNPDRHTDVSYSHAIKDFLNWIGFSLPTDDLITAYIAHLKAERCLSSRTIGSKYLAAIRLYLRKLKGQRITGFRGDERDYISDCRDHIQAALDACKAPPPDTTSTEPALYQYGTRLSRQQVEQVYASIERDTIKGRRDLALLYLGFTSGLRLAELQRLTLASIEAYEDHYLVRVRGKRNNVAPVPLDHDAIGLMQKYVETYNADLELDDPRYIHANTPLWQTLLHGNNHAHVGVNGYNPKRGISTTGIRNIVVERVQRAIGIKATPHDMRRTVAHMGRKEGMEMESIQKLLRHKNLATTARYVGDVMTYDASLISRRKRFEGIRD